MSAVSTLVMLKPTLVSFTSLSKTVLLGIVQLDKSVVGVSTGKGVMEQERKIEDPDTNSFSFVYTVTNGLGTKERQRQQ